LSRLPSPELEPAGAAKYPACGDGLGWVELESVVVESGLVGSDCVESGLPCAFDGGLDGPGPMTDSEEHAPRMKAQATRPLNRAKHLASFASV
jgi:hypothetical protein